MSAAALALGSPAAGVVWPDQPQQVRAVPVIRAADVSVRPTPVPMRVAPMARTRPPVSFVEKSPQVADHRYATAALNVRAKPSDGAKVLDVLTWAEKVGVTGRSRGDWAEIVVGKRRYWVKRTYLAERKPRPEHSASPSQRPGQQPSQVPSTTPGPTAPASPTPSTPPPGTGGLSTAPCSSGSAVEGGLVQNAVEVHRAVCAAFPQVTTYGGLRPGDTGDHGTGHALDIMIPDSATGDRIAAWVRSHATELHVDYVIWAQHIWSVERSSEGWRPMEDRGSVTANHYDHVHVTVS